MLNELEPERVGRRVSSQSRLTVDAILCNLEVGWCRSDLNVIIHAVQVC